MKKLLTLTLIGLTFSVYAQIPPSPGSMGVVREASVPVNLYTGIPQITVPLYTLPHHNGHSIPVFLSYHAGGHKVQDVAGPVGLGWTLNGGGQITRVVRGRPDNGTIGNPANYDQWINQIGIDHPNPNYQGEQNDLEYDLFFFKLPNGRSGKFIVNTSGDGYALPYQNIKIEKIGDFNNAKWRIIDENGDQYLFNWSGNEYETTESNTSLEDGTYDVNDKLTFVSTWFLSRIDYYNSPNDVNYSYVPKSSYEYEVYNNVASVSWDNCDGLNSSSNYKANTKIKIISPKYLSTITTKKGIAQLTWSNSRQDISNTYLQKLEIKDRTNSLVNSFNLTYSYSDAGNSRWFAGASFNCDGPPSISNEDRFRLTLNEISRDGFLHRRFYYKHNESFENPIAGCTYGVDTYQLPPRNSFFVDHWGFASYMSFGGTPVWEASFTLTKKEGFTLVDGHSRNPNLDGSLSNMLYKIEYPSAGFTEFEYELNKGLLYTSSASATQENIGGLRVKEIRNFEGGNLAEKTSYTYDKGWYREKPIYYYGYFYNTSTNTGTLVNDYYDFPSSPCRDINSTISSHSFNSLFDLNGVHVEYSSVTESKSGFGSTKYEYYSSRDRNGYEDELPLIERFGPWTAYHDFGKYGPPFSPFTTNFWKRGALKKVSTYKSGVTHPIQTVNYRYNFLSTGIEFTSKKGIRPNNIGVVSQSYYDRVDIVHLDEIETKIYSEFSATNYTSNLIEYKYLSGSNNSVLNAGLPNEIIISFADGSKSKTLIKYPFNLPTGGVTTGSVTAEADAIWNLISDNAINNTIEVVKFFQEEGDASFSVLSGSIIEYNIMDDDSSLPIRSFGLSLNEPLSSSSFNDSFFSSSNINIYHKDSRYEPINIFWYNPQNEISRKQNLIGGQITDFEYDSYGYVDKVEYDPLNDLNRKSTYSTKSLVGLQTETDMNDKSVSYEYDSRNRLHLIRDEENNIVERYRYNYRNEANEIAADLNISGTNLIGQSLTFKAKNVHMYGSEADYKWRIGGTSYTGKTVTVPFNSSGNNVVTLYIINPEYDEPFEESTIIRIFDQMYSPSISGPPSYDACNHQFGNTVTFYPNLLGAGATCINGSTPSSTSEWFYRAGNGSYISLGTQGTLPEYILQSPGNYTIKLEVTDSCNNTYMGTHDFQVTYDCGGGGGGIEIEKQ